MTGRIYKIINDINDKVYVGQTIRTLAQRFQKHCSYSDDVNHTMAIKKAIHKYGRDHFKIVLLEELSDCNQETLNEREIYWVAYYDAYTKGYNLTKGGQFCGHSQKLSIEEENKLVELYKTGWSSLKIAKVFNIDKTTVLNYAKKHNLRRKDTLEEKVNIEEVKVYIRENKPTVSDVVSKFKISRSSVYNLIKRSKDNTLILKSYNPRKSNAKIKFKEVCDKYREGYNIQDLVKMFHSSKKYISKILKDNGIIIQRGRKAML
jgi:group I intron endonuclease